VDDLLADVDWWAERFERDTDDVNGADHPGAETSRLE
jgi:hypothetical protein